MYRLRYVFDVLNSSLPRHNVSYYCMYCVYYYQVQDPREFVENVWKHDNEFGGEGFCPTVKKMDEEQVAAVAIEETIFSSSGSSIDRDWPEGPIMPTYHRRYANYLNPNLNNAAPITEHQFVFYAQKAWKKEFGSLQGFTNFVGGQKVRQHCPMDQMVAYNIGQWITTL